MEMRARLEGGKSGGSASEHPENPDDHMESARTPRRAGHDLTKSQVVEAALAFALTEAAKAQRFDVVSQLAKELEARRLDCGNVVRLAPRKVFR